MLTDNVQSAAPRRVCLVGYGRAGHVHRRAIEDLHCQAEEELCVDDDNAVASGPWRLCCVVDPCGDVRRRAGAADGVPPLPASVTWHATLAEALRAHAEIDLVVVCTPTATHHAVCLEALRADKHVLVEKPLAHREDHVRELYAEAHARGRLLYTAFNRRSDPEWERLTADVASTFAEPPLHVQVLCRDFPHPPAAYLATCGGIFRDAAVHDLDMLCVLLQDTPVKVRATLDARGETASIDLVFSRGTRAHLVHSRHSTYYDQRVAVVGVDGMLEFGGDASARALSGSFQERYRASYAQQLRDVAARLARDDVAPNVSLEHALFLERLLAACDASATEGGRTVHLQTLRAHVASKTTVRELYRAARAFHTRERTCLLRARYAPKRDAKPIGIWDALRRLETFVDVSDPDVDVPNMQHALQTAESLRRADMPEWLQLVGLIHDFGKLLVDIGRDDDGTSASTQWSVVGDTFVVGHPLPEALVYPEFHELASFHGAPSGYAPGCGLDACDLSYGHDEYLYWVLRASRTRLPEAALRIVRYHSLYAWHQADAYAELENVDDRAYKGWVKLFNLHDLYSKTEAAVDVEGVRAHYDRLAATYLPYGLAF